MIDLTQTRAALAALPDARGVPELLAILGRCEQDLATAHAAIQVAGRATGDLWEFHAALVGLRPALEPIRDAWLAYGDEVDALYWARSASPAATQLLLTLIRRYQHRLADLLWCLPYPSLVRDREEFHPRAQLEGCAAAASRPAGSP